jgi:hypothetical protein
MKLLLRHKHTYGKDRYYPDCAKSQALLKLGRPGKLCFTNKDMLVLYELFTVKVLKD